MKSAEFEIAKQNVTSVLDFFLPATDGDPSHPFRPLTDNERFRRKAMDYVFINRPDEVQVDERETILNYLQRTIEVGTGDWEANKAAAE